MTQPKHRPERQTFIVHVGAASEQAVLPEWWGALDSEVQSRALRYAQENMDSNFAFASDLAKARDLKDFLEIQQRYAQKQAMTYTQQAQELGRLMADAAQMAQRKM